MITHHAGDNYGNLRVVAEYLGLTERSVRRYIAEGELPAYRLGPREIRIKWADVDRLLTPVPTATTGTN